MRLCPWSLASRVSVLGKAVLGLGLGFFFVLGLGLEPSVLDSTSDIIYIYMLQVYRLQLDLAKAGLSFRNQSKISAARLARKSGAVYSNFKTGALSLLKAISLSSIREVLTKNLNAISS